jgi:SRSO17 transposase
MLLLSSINLQSAVKLPKPLKPMVTAPRPATPTVKFIDDYCQNYQHLFSDVRNYEAFKLLHLGLLSELPRKSLPRIARAVGLSNSQS